MKRIAVLLTAAFFAGALLAGFSDNLDVSGLKDVPAECLVLNGIDCVGSRNGNVWIPADVHANENGELVMNGSGGYSSMATLGNYIDFGKYNDEASIESFMNRGEFLNSRGELKYTQQDIASIYTKMEDANYNLFELAVDQVNSNLERWMAEQSADAGGGGGANRDKVNKAVAGWKKFLHSAKNQGAIDKEQMLAHFASLSYQGSDVQRQKYTQAALAAQKTIANLKEQVAEIDKLAVKFDVYIYNSMVNVNRIGAYLGSTNSMEFFGADVTVDTWGESEYNRWSMFSVPPQIGDAASRPFGKLGTMNSPEFDTILGQLAPSYYMMFADADYLERFASVYDNGQFNINKIHGFAAEVEDDGDNTTTNWVAKNITAPANWADGSTISVIDGKFTAGTTTTPWSYSAKTHSITNCVYLDNNSLVELAAVVVDGAAVTNGQERTYYLHIPYDPSAAASVDTDPTKQDNFNVKVNSVKANRQTFTIGAIPQIYKFQ